jgi:formylglycine-generating enzyme
MKTTSFELLLTVIVSIYLPSFAANCPTADLTGDCQVDLADLAVMASQWLQRGATDTMALIPGGAFLMGDQFGEGAGNEIPVHAVQLSRFYLAKNLTTNGDYCVFLNAIGEDLKVVSGMVYARSDTANECPYFRTSFAAPLSQIIFTNGSFWIRSKGTRDMSRDPVIYVSWYGAVTYCNWLSQQEGLQPSYDPANWTCDFNKSGYRLPTEAEWEYSAKGGLIGKRFPYGDTISHSQANYVATGQDAFDYDVSPTLGYHPAWNDGIMPYTSPVGSLAPNHYGLCDMAGNVFEWCNDWYRYDSYWFHTAVNPTGPDARPGDPSRVLRGGAWDDVAVGLRVSSRHAAYPPTQTQHYGFRVALSVLPRTVAP